MKTPYFVIDLNALDRNLAILSDVRAKSGCKILLAQKAFSCFPVYRRIAAHLDGTTASGLYEARLGKETFGKETHVFSPAFTDDDVRKLVKIADHIVFNSPVQLRRHVNTVRANGLSVGLRVNPECSTQDGHAIYDPCAVGSRLGTTRSHLTSDLYPFIDGIHMHTLCEQNSDALETTVQALEAKFGDLLSCVKWINLGGGHHITREDYDRERLIQIVKRLKKTYGAEVYLEPGEAVVLNAGELVSTVLDVMENNGVKNAILDASAACHLPDVLEMPYRPSVLGADVSGAKAYTYRLGGNTCLSGDVIGDYSFDRPLSVGDTVRFLDMALYTFVKTNTFNGTPLPALAVRENGQERVIKTFGYQDFKNRLG